MPLTIRTLEETETMAKYTVKERLYYTEDKARVVPEGDPDARFLFAPAGRQILEETARKFGLLDSEAGPDGANSEPPAIAASAVEDQTGSSGDVVASVTAEPEPAKSSPVEADTGDGHVCPDCGKICKSGIGLRSHRRAKHGT